MLLNRFLSWWSAVRHGTPAQAAPSARPRATEADFRWLVEGVRDYAIFMLDPRGFILTWNRGGEHAYGYNPGDIIGQHFSVFYPADDIRARKPERDLELAAAQDTYEEEGWRVRKDGSQFWANVLITALRDGQGKLRGFSKVTRDMTERRLAEENVRSLLREEAARAAAEARAVEAERAKREEQRQRTQLQVTLSCIGDGVIVTDADGNVTFANPVAEVLTGWHSAEIIGKPLESVFNIVNEFTRVPPPNPVRRVLETGVTVGLANHTMLIARDGSERPIDDSAAPIRTDDGALIGVVLVFRDVTESRKASSTSRHLAAIVESSDDAIISKTLDGVIVSWNRGAERLYGYLADEIIGQPITRLIPPGHPDELPHLIDRLKRGERIEHFETQRVCKDGRCLNVSLTISPIKDDEGKIVGASKIARDITAQKRRETGLTFLAESGKLLSELLDVPSTLNRVAQLAVPKFADWCSVDLLEGDQQLVRVAVAHADPAKVELAEELRKKYPPDPHAPVGAWSVIRMGRSELVADIPDSLLAQAIRDPELLGVIRRLGLRSYIGVPLIVSGRTMGVITFIAAESGHRYDRADLQIAEELAQRAAIAIENARLYNEVKQASRRKDEFLAMLGHELRNPLAPIRSALQIMNTPNVGEAALAEARQVTQRQVQHLARLVDDLLDVSRIMRGHIELRRQPVSLQTVLSHAIETVQPLVNERKQQLIVDMPSKPVMLEADATRLTQAIGNLLNNASKFSSSPGRFWLTAKLDGGEAVISVRDEGIGIPRETLPYIFDLFVQGDQSLERTEGGLGIGLTVVRKLIEMHGGRIMADSRGPGQGSEFVIHLPTVQAPTSPRPEKPRDPAADAKRRRVLVVDDSVDAAKTIAMLLRLWGHDVKTAHDGAEALAIAHDFLPEVVLLDIGLPGMNGYELARRMRSEPPLAKVRLVAVSGYGQQEDLRRSKEAGFDQHFTKPVEPAALERLLRETDPPRNGN